MLPTFDSYTQSAINTVQAVEASYNRYRQILTQSLNNFNKFAVGKNFARKDNQGRVVDWLKSLRDNRQLVNIWTPYGEYDNLAIIDISGTQNNSKYQSDLEIQFQQWKNISTSTREATKAEKAYWTQVQRAKTQELGNASTQDEDVSTVKYLIDKGINPIKKMLGG